MTAAPEPGSPRLPPLVVICGAGLLWGVAEATWFFLVPDVLLTFVALREGLRAGLAAALSAALGAAIGGVLLAHFAALDTDGATALLRSVPFLSDTTIGRGLAAMTSADWPAAMLRGSFSGVPYKVYAAGAGIAGIGPASLLLASLPIRLVRFAAAVVVVDRLGTLAAGASSPATRTALLAAFWLLFYGEFWFRWSGWLRALIG